MSYDWQGEIQPEIAAAIAKSVEQHRQSADLAVMIQKLFVDLATGHISRTDEDELRRRIELVLEAMHVEVPE